jgi:LPS sulfotransferase NodH
LLPPVCFVTVGPLTVVRSSYLICANQRSGSTLVCRGLAGTGVAGYPEEYFLDGPPSAFPPGWGFWENGLFAQRHGGVRSRRDYLDLVFRIGTTPNGVFGAKLMWNNMVWVVRRFRGLDELAGLRRPADIFRSVFPQLRLVRLVRRNVVRQAVSWARAAQEEVWVVSDTEPPKPAAEPAYSYELVAALVGLLLVGEAGWRRFARELRIAAHVVQYEDLLTEDGYHDGIRGILRHLELDDTVAIDAPRTKRQADALNDEWVERFLADANARHHPALDLLRRRSSARD